MSWSRALIVVLVGAAFGAGCGPTPPQAPVSQAKKLDIATGDISTACGLQYQLTAFPGPRQPYEAIHEATATTAAHKLASVYRLGPAWIYQGETVAKIVSDSLTMLDQCGLTHAAAALRHSTRMSS